MQRVQLVLENPGDKQTAGVTPGSTVDESNCLTIPPGTSTLDWYVPAVNKERETTLEFLFGDAPPILQPVMQSAVAGRTAHLIQFSHHDVGYTDLPSRVIAGQVRNLREALTMARANENRGNASRFRVIIEAGWSLIEFLKQASSEETDALVALLHNGDIEVTALFANTTTELCNHSLLYDTIRPIMELRKRLGFPVSTAVNDDIPGITWGLCSALVEARVTFFCPFIPNYYGWAKGYKDIYDIKAILGHETPGAFHWESPSGKRLLVWLNDTACDGVSDGFAAEAERRIINIYHAQPELRNILVSVRGGGGDNSPYTDSPCDAVEAWNATWETPLLRTSTLADFHQALQDDLPDDLPVIRGEWPAHDYATAAMSTSRATVAFRRAQTERQIAQIAGVVANTFVGHKSCDDDLRACREDLLYYAAHAWGHHFPAGPGQEAALMEKSVRALRAKAIAHDIKRKALAALADRVELEESGPHLLLFNALSEARSGLVRLPLRELDNASCTLAPRHYDEVTDERSGALKLYSLGDRWNVVLDEAMAQGAFTLIDVESGVQVPFHVETIRDAFASAEHAPERLGLGLGATRYGFFENPAGIRRELTLLTPEIPGLGYRLIRMVPQKPEDGGSPSNSGLADTIQNRRWTFTAEAKGVKANQSHDGKTAEASKLLGQIVVTSPSSKIPTGTADMKLTSRSDNPVFESLVFEGSAPGCPKVRQEWILPREDETAELRVTLLKDPTPLQEVWLSLPFEFPVQKVRYQSNTTEVVVPDDFWPGSCTNRVTIQDYLALEGADATLLFSSPDAPVLSVGELWPSYTSPAHSCIPPKQDTPWATNEGLKHGGIHVLLSANNFGTNFAASQCDTITFRFFFNIVDSVATPPFAASWGARVRTPLEPIMTEHQRKRALPPSGSLLRMEPEGMLHILDLTIPADGEMAARIWNPDRKSAEAVLTLQDDDAYVLVQQNASTIEEGNNSWRISLAPSSSTVLTWKRKP